MKKMFLLNKYFRYISIGADLHPVKRLLFCAVLLLSFHAPCSAQTKYAAPAWWFGVAGGVNYNMYTGTTQRANEVTVFPSAFGKGNGFGGFGALSLEYRLPHSMIGFMLQQGIDDRSADFDLPGQEFSVHLGYITVEPSIRIAPFRSNFYIYGGPRIGFLATSDFTYKRNGFPDYPDATSHPDAKFYISSVRKNPVSMQIGAGYDIYVSEKTMKTQFVISPFASYFPTMWRKNIRTIESLYLNTIRAGITLKVGCGRKIVPLIPPVPVVIDRDGDGIPDMDDRCPDTFGLAALRGCPDRDADGIADIDDKCPDVFGFARYEGCPIPDRDKDGVNDELDKCPDVFGLARYQGCPIPDTDGDGVNDEEDKCPRRAGPASNKGCPVIAREVIEKINFAAKNIFFATGSYTLLPKSFKSLDAVVELLNADNSLMIDIDGHTDSQGSDESNQVLSDNRAGAVKNYLVSKNIDAARLKSAGFGETRPVADNTTVAGRAKNRRTEMTVRNF